MQLMRTMRMKKTKDKQSKTKDNKESKGRLYERMNGETIYHTNKDKDIIT